LHKDPEIEALLPRKGTQPLNEDELLQVIRIALTYIKSNGIDSNSNPAAAHMLTGLGPFGVLGLMKKGFDVDNGTMQDPRTALLGAALLASRENNEASEGPSGSTMASPSSASWSKNISAGNMAESAPEADATTPNEAVLLIARKRYSS
jgi:hypothetical protein